MRHSPVGATGAECDGLPATKVRALRAVALRVPLPSPVRFAGRAVDSRGFCAITATSASGRVGVATVPSDEPRSVAAFVNDRLAPLVLEQCPECGRRQALASETPTSIAEQRSRSGVDIALWDLDARCRGLPLFRLLGGTRTSVAGYASGGYLSAQGGDVFAGLERELSELVDEGFDAAKIKIGALEVKDDLQRVRLARRILGDDRDLMVDANAAYDLDTAITVGRALEALNVRFFEEPVDLFDRQAGRTVSSALTIPIAGGERERDLDGFRALAREAGVGVLQPNAAFVGGVTGFLEIAKLADSLGASVVPHWGQELHAHLVSATDAAGAVECFAPAGRIRMEELLYATTPALRAGAVNLSDAAGVGTTLDPDALHTYATPTEGLQDV